MNNFQLKPNERNIQHVYAEIAKSITSSLDFSTILQNIMEQIHLFFKPENWSLLRIDEESRELYFVICKGEGSDKIKNLRLKLGVGVVGKVAETGKHLIVNDVSKSKHFSKLGDKISGFSTSSLVAVPIIFQKKILGVIELINIVKNGNFSKYDLEILKTIADFSAIAINNALIHEQIVFLATHDALTKVYNRAFLHGFQENLLSPSIETNDATTVILIDIDYFKKINDTVGHAEGDLVLIKMANLLKNICRKSDFVFRVGGDEFLVIMTNMRVNETAKVKEEIRKKLMNILKQEKLGFSFSFGISSGKINQLESVIKAADAKMYKAKNSRSYLPISNTS